MHKPHFSSGVTALTAAGRNISIANNRIPHQELLAAIQAADQAGGIAAIYRTHVAPVKTRTIHLLGKKGPAKIIHTLLGYEVQAAYKRIHCPDMVTARYLKLFSELGCHAIKLPYDPTITAKLVPQLERAQERIASEVEGAFPHQRTLQLYVIRRLYGLIRRQLKQES